MAPRQLKFLTTLQDHSNNSIIYRSTDFDFQAVFTKRCRSFIYCQASHDVWDFTPCNSTSCSLCKHGRSDQRTFCVVNYEVFKCITVKPCVSACSFQACATLGGNRCHQRWIQGAEVVRLQREISGLFLLPSGLVSTFLGLLFGYQMCSWGRESAVGSFAARSSAPPRSSPSATACTSSMRSTQRWSPARWTPSSLIWPGKRDRYATPNQLPVVNITSKFPPLQDQYAQKTGRTWTNENPSAVRPDSPDFKRLRSVSGGPRTHTEVWFPPSTDFTGII